MSGLVLVWDMDNTLVGNYFDVTNESTSESLLFNRKALAILKQAVAAKKRGVVDAIFMLTNNADKNFINYVQGRINDRLGERSVFDYTMDRTHTARPQSDNPPKRLEDVEYMMRALNKSTYNLKNRVFFFDDIPDHEIFSEIPADHYIHIFPRFELGVIDRTNFKPLEVAISARVGGRRRPKKQTKRTRAKRRRSKKNLTNIVDDM